jgi:hypothetical protein
MRYLIGLSILLTSCSLYKQEFDCPPGEGIPCVPVTTIEKMMVETEAGPDLCLGCVPELPARKMKPGCTHSANQEQLETFQRRIWFAPHHGECCYVYFDEELQCEKQ